MAANKHDVEIEELKLKQTRMANNASLLHKLLSLLGTVVIIGVFGGVTICTDNVKFPFAGEGVDCIARRGSGKVLLSH